jgi:hypothetical protein
MRKVVLNSEEYAQLKAKAILSEPKMARINLSDIEFSNLSIRDNVVNIQGKAVAVNNVFIKAYLTQLGLNPKFLSGYKGDERTVTDILNVLNEEKRKLGNVELRMIVSHSNEVINLIPMDKGGRVSNTNVFKIADDLMNRHGLQVIDSTIESNTGLVALNLITPNVQKIANLNEEQHQFGIKLTNSVNGTEIMDFAYRLTCTNGATAMDTYSKFKLESLNPSEIEKLFTHVSAMEKNQFIPTGFEDMLKASRTTLASISEVEHGIFSLVNRLNMPIELDKEDTERITAQFINSNFAEYANRKAKLLAKGYDLEKLTPQEKKFIKCDITMWDLVNRITYFASNNTSSNFKEVEKLQIIGGSLLSKKDGYDLSNDRIKLLSL